MRVQASVQGIARVEEIRPERTEGRRLAAIAMVLAFGLFLSLVGVSPARANHVGATLDCGDHGSWDVDGQSDLPSGFDRPSPWTGLFLLEDTTHVFRAFEMIEIGGDQRYWVIPARQRHLIACTLSFARGDWTLYGVLRQP